MEEIEWRSRFAERIKLRSECDDDFAWECADNAEYYPDWTPEDSADEEMSYWEE